MTTLEEAKEFVTKHLSKGTICPCCGGYAKLYQRKLNAEMTRFLKKLVELYVAHGDWIDVRDIVNSSTYAATTERLPLRHSSGYLVHWGFVETQGKRQWKPTQKGMAYVEGKLDAPKFVYLHNNKLQGVSTERTTFQKSSLDRFDINEL